MKSSFENEDFIIVVVKENRDPRSFSPIPSFVAFRAPGRKLFAFFPHNDESLREEIFQFLSRKILLVRKPEAVRKWLSPTKAKFPHVHAATLAMKYGFGRSDDGIAGYVWDKRFCIVSRDEWFCDPLSRSQETHAAYALNMLDALITKVGLANVMENLSGPRFVARV